MGLDEDKKIKYPTLSEYSSPLKAAEREIIGRDREIRLLMAAMLRPELSNVILLAEAGSGKLLTLETPIPTPTGWTTMGDLKPGDQVLGRDGRPTTVTFTSEVDPSPVLYDITLSDGQVITACADHQWLVASVDSRRQAYDCNLTVTKARRARMQERSDALRALIDGAPEFISVRDLLVLISDIPNITWSNSGSLHTYLLKQGVERRGVARRVEQAWKGRTRMTTVHVDEFCTADALVALAEQKHRRTTWGTDGEIGESVLTTQQMVDAGVMNGAHRRFSIRLTKALELPERDLFVDPYVLGAWLGDGSTNKGSFTQSDETPSELSDMAHLIDQITSAGFNAHRAGSDGKTIGTHGLQKRLREIGVLSKKHIPIEYLRASVEQRLSLLQGLMDTDGTIDSDGACDLTLSDEVLARDAEELIRSLGIKVQRVVSDAGYRDAEGNLVLCKPRHRMVFTTTQSVFRLPRKARRLPKQTRSTQGWLYITDITPVPSRPGKCIQVDNAEHMYLAGEGFVPTHNTALVQAAMVHDKGRHYLEVDLAKMIANLSNSDEMASRLKALFDEAETYHHAEGRELVLFIDEFHQIVQLSAAAVEALKPVLAASGTRGLRIVAATTYDEFREYVSPNQPLVERLQRISLAPPNRVTTVAILRGMAERYKVADQFFDDSVFDMIYEYTDRYMTSQAQPRKSILLLDAMVGWHRLTGAPMNKALLAQVMKDTANIDVAFSVDATTIRERLDKVVLSQRLATATITQRLQLCVADLHDKSKPISSFLFTGSTGVGKATSDNTLVPVYIEDGSVSWKRAGDLVVGDKVFKRDGGVQDVLGVFPQGMRDIYRVTLWDGRTLDVDGQHLWGVYTEKMRSNKHAGKNVEPKVMTTLEMLDAGVVRTYPGDTREHLKFFIPANGAVQWPERDLKVHPYALGALIGNGALRTGSLTLSSNDPSVVQRVAELLGLGFKKLSAHNYNWAFPTGSKRGCGDALAQTKDVLSGTPGLVGAYSGERRIPAEYMTASIEQRWELVRGLFDTDGSINATTGRFNVSYSTFSEGLAADVRELLFSLGISNTVKVSTRTKEDGRALVEHSVHVKVGNADKARFFWLARKRDIAERAAVETRGRDRVKKFDMVGISSIEKLLYKESATCIYVSEDEHLYQAGEFIVTHNTEMTKQLAKLLFGDDQAHLIRFDMSEFSNDDTFDHFRSMLTARVWARAHSVILFDEIEKASAKVVRLLLQILDDGRLSDDNGRQVSFLNSYIVMTTNAGSEIFSTIAQYNVDDTGEGKDLIKRMREIRNSISTTQGDNRFPPELLGRIDAIVPFQPLSRATQESIVRNKLRLMRDEVRTKHGVKVEIHPDVLQYLIEDKGETDSDAGGARTAVARMTTDVTTQIATFINKFPRERFIGVSVAGEMVSKDKNLLESDAHIVVKALR